MAAGGVHPHRGHDQALPAIRPTHDMHVVAVRTCSRLGRQANPPAGWGSIVLRLLRRR